MLGRGWCRERENVYLHLGDEIIFLICEAAERRGEGEDHQILGPCAWINNFLVILDSMPMSLPLTCHVAHYLTSFDLAYMPCVRSAILALRKDLMTCSGKGEIERSIQESHQSVIWPKHFGGNHGLLRWPKILGTAPSANPHVSQEVQKGAPFSFRRLLGVSGTLIGLWSSD